MSTIYKKSKCKTTLLLSSMALPLAAQLADAAERKGWAVSTLLNSADLTKGTDIVFYGSTLDAHAVAERFDLALLEPPLDLLAALPYPLLLRQVHYGQWADIPRSSERVFLKPADALDTDSFTDGKL